LRLRSKRIDCRRGEAFFARSKSKINLFNKKMLCPTISKLQFLSEISIVKTFNVAKRALWDLTGV